MVSLEDGLSLRASPNETLTFPEVVSGQFVPNSVTGGSISTFSSWGPSSELKIKPNVATPGGKIYSTFPLALGAYAILSGTSMATPYLTGVAALWLGAKGQTDPLKLRDIMSYTATPIDFNDGHGTSVGTLAPVIQQGGGFINAAKLLSSTTTLSPGFIELNVSLIDADLTLQDTTNFEGTKVISLTNNGNGTVSYSFGSINAATVFGFTNNTDQISSFPPQLNNDTPISVAISPGTLQLQPGTSGNFTATFTLNQNFDRSRLPIYSGWLVVNSSAPGDGGALQIPFMGVATSMSSLPLFNESGGMPSLTTLADSPDNLIAIDGTVFTLTNASTTPCINWELIFGPRVFRVDVLPGEGNTAGTTEFVGLGIIGYVLAASLS